MVSRYLDWALVSFRVSALSTKIVLTRSSSMSAPSLCSAFAIADSSTFLMILAPFFGLNARTLSARSTGNPRIWSATRRPFCAERRTPRSVAVVCIMGSLLLPGRRGRGHLLVGRVALEGARQREFAQLVANHVFRHVDRNVRLAVMHGDRQAHEIRRDGGAARPGPDRLLVVDRARLFHLGLQVTIDERAFLD